MPNPFEVVVESALELQDAIPSPFEALAVDDGESALHEEINGRRAAAESPEGLRLARAL
jgi:hypothetical protein